MLCQSQRNGDDHADVLVLELGDDVLDVFNRYRVDSCERLVQKDELRALCRRLYRNRRKPGISA